ncbi:seipin [Adelges cooleyi]|uniref:seipin n=1 Tax=Adelges cooleyi TaxID=133065 RepID=UPI0021806137|nr:seipin [Adelges cooleyi]
MFGFLTRYIDRKVQRVKKSIMSVGLWATLAAYRGSVFWMSVVTVVWASIFLYAAFYTAYMPSLAYTRPVHMQYKPCYSNKGVCDYPSAHIKLPTKSSMMMIGQKYRIIINLDLPESPVNEQVGMFMVCARLADRHGQLVSSSCRSARIRYISDILRNLRTVVKSPLYLSGLAEEKQSMVLEMYTDFEEDRLHPITDIHFEVLDHDVQIYAARMTILARLSGLRYLMYHWPVFSALVGIGTNLLFAFAVFAMSWRHLFGSEVIDNKHNSESSSSHGSLIKLDSSEDSSESSSDSADYVPDESNVFKVKRSTYAAADLMIAEQ